MGPVVAANAHAADPHFRADRGEYGGDSARADLGADRPVEPAAA